MEIFVSPQRRKELSAVDEINRHIRKVMSAEILKRFFRPKKPFRKPTWQKKVRQVAYIYKILNKRIK